MTVVSPDPHLDHDSLSLTLKITHHTQLLFIHTLNNTVNPQNKQETQKQTRAKLFIYVTRIDNQ